MAGVFLLLQLRSPEHKLVVGGAQVLEVVLLEADEAPQVGLSRQRAAEAVHHVLPVLLLLDEQHVEDLLVAPAAVVRRLVTFPPVEPNVSRSLCTYQSITLTILKGVINPFKSVAIQN